MRSWWLQPRSGTMALEAREVARPQPAPGQLLVRLRAAGLNRGEFLTVHGANAPAAAKPAGTEGAGEVESVGAEVTQFAPGMRVMGRCAGAFAEYALFDQREAIAIPSRLDWEEAAAVPLVFMVVHDMLIGQGGLQAGEWLLVTGISSGVGVASLQAAKVLGASVIGTSGAPHKLERLRALGLDLGIATRGADFFAAVLQATGGKGANLAVNNVGGTMFAECVRALGYEGRLATVGYVDGVLKAEMDIEALHTRRLRLFGVSNKLRNTAQRAHTVRGFVSDLLPAIADGRIAPLVDRVFEFGQLAEAKAHMEANAHVGKIVLRVA